MRGCRELFVEVEECITIGCTGQISAVTFCANTRTKAAIINLLGEPGVRHNSIKARITLGAEMEVRKSSRLFIVDSEGRLLLFLYQDEHQAPFWATAGGELKSGESYTDAAARELYEETGLTLKIGNLLKERDEVYAVARSTPARWLEKYYLVKCPPNSNI